MAKILDCHILIPKGFFFLANERTQENEGTSNNSEVQSDAS